MKRISAILALTLVFATAASGANDWLQPADMIRAMHITATTWGAGSRPNKSANNVQPAATVAPVGLTQGAAAGVTQVSAAGVSGTAVAVTQSASDIDEGQVAYDSLTNTADFNYKPAFVESKFQKNELFQDIAVSAVEAVPFGFLLTFAGIYVSEAAGQGTIQPKLKTLQDYTPVYAVSIGALAVANIVINTLFFYDYKKENSHGKKTEEK